MRRIASSASSVGQAGVRNDHTGWEGRASRISCAAAAAVAAASFKVFLLSGCVSGEDARRGPCAWAMGVEAVMLAKKSIRPEFGAMWLEEIQAWPWYEQSAAAIIGEPTILLVMEAVVGV